MPGYDRTRIVGVTDQELDEFTCGICLGLFAAPVVTQCCRQTYCKDCIREWVSLHKTCPNDRKTLTKKGLKPVPRVLDNLLDNMKIRCNFEADGCSHAIRIGELAQHLTVCEFRPNQLCKTCGLIKESVLTHNCIQALVSEKQKIDEKYMNLLDENSTLLLIRREKDEAINGLRRDLAQLKINNQRAVDKLKAENSKVVQNFKQSYSRAYEELRDYQANEMDRMKLNYTDQKRTNSDLRWQLSDYERRLFSNQNILRTELEKNKELTEILKSCRTSLGMSVKTLVIIVGICLYRYFY